MASGRRDDPIAVEVQIAPEFSGQVDARSLTEAARVALADEGRHRAGVCIVVTDDEEMRKLNRTYRGLDEPTDVLSFAAQEGREPFQVGDPQAGDYLGDIVIAFPFARRQAESRGQEVADELRLLIVHGILHLLGYDHAEAEDEARMWERQRQLLRLLLA